MKNTVSFRPGKQRKGFSLVEALIAMVVLAIALLALAGVVVSTTMLMGHTIDKEKAVDLAVEKLEVLEADYDEIEDGLEKPDNSKFILTWTVNDAVGTGGKEITLHVRWDGALGSREVTLERFVADPEPE